MGNNRFAKVVLESRTTLDSRILTQKIHMAKKHLENTFGQKIRN